MFKETDSIIAIGKLFYSRIPLGKHCNLCPLLGHVVITNNFFCDLRSGIGLTHDGETIFKPERCPRYEEG